ncbi:hypothetical protein GGR08_000655 [Bartonella fuyuanensis]|uniref:Uncharacterized protein n=1 Tax=Bartonella fuyuanensis TaxID=1460968 RepID=A0A840E2E7_9HYPH|nr:hypothetical protein [Bartonella fuyuanensis]
MLTIVAVDNFTKNKRAKIICKIILNTHRVISSAVIKYLSINFFILEITKYVDIFLEEKDDTTYKIECRIIQIISEI